MVGAESSTGKVAFLNLDSGGNLKVVASGTTSTQYTDETAETAGAFVGTVAMGYNGTDVVGLRLDASNNLKVNLETAIPAGSNVIGGTNLYLSGTEVGLGTQTAANSVPVALPSATITALTPPTAAAIGTSVSGDLLIGTQAAGSSVPVALPTATITTLTPPTAAAIGTSVSGDLLIGTQVAGSSVPVALPTATITTLTPPTAAAIGSAVAGALANPLPVTAVITSTDISMNIAQVGGANVGSGNPLYVEAVSGSTTAVTGTVTVVGDAANGAVIAGNPVLVAGSDGTDARTLLASSTGQLHVIVDSGASGGTQYTDGTAETAGAFVGTVALGYNGTDVVGLRMDASNNLKVNLETAIPAGSNVIGHVIVDSGTVTTVSTVSTVTAVTAITDAVTVEGNVASGSAVSGANAPVLAAGQDGTDVRTLLTDSAGQLKVLVENTVPASQSGSWTVTANAGSGTFGTLDAATSATGSNVPADASYVGAANPSGKLTGLLVDASGYLEVNVKTGGGTPPANGATGSPVPADADFIGFGNGTGNLTGVSNSTPLPTQDQAPALDQNVAGSGITNTQAVTVSTVGYATVLVEVTGTWTGIIAAQVLLPDGSTWQAVDVGTWTAGVVGGYSSSITGNGQFIANVAGAQKFRAIGATVTGGSASVSIEASLAYQGINKYEVAGPGNAVVGGYTAVAVCGAHSGSALVLATDNSGNLNVTNTGSFPVQDSAAEGYLGTLAGTVSGGKISVSAVQGSGATFTVVGPANSGSGVSGGPVLVGGSDGTDVRTLLTDNTGQLKVLVEDTVTVTGSVSGTGTFDVAQTSLPSDLTVLSQVITATAENAAIATNGAAEVVFNVTGTWVGTLQPQYQLADSSWVSGSVFPTLPSGVSVSTVTANGQFKTAVGGFKAFRLLSTGTWTSGAATINLEASQFQTFIQATVKGASGAVLDAAPGAAAPANGLMVGGSDGTDFRALLASSTGQLHVVADTGSTTAVTQGTAANLNATVVGTGTFAVQAATTPAASTYQGVSAVSGSASAKTAPIFVAVADGTNTSVLGAYGTAPATSVYAVPTMAGVTVNVGGTPTSVTGTGTSMNVTAVSGSTTAVTGVVEVSATGSANSKTNPIFIQVADGTNDAVLGAMGTAAATSVYAVPVMAGLQASVSGTQTALTGTGTSLNVNVTNAVSVEGHAGGVLDAVTAAATAPASGLATLVEYETTVPSLTAGQSVMAQADAAGSTYVNIEGRRATYSAYASFTGVTGVNAVLPGNASTTARCTRCEVSVSTSGTAGVVTTSLIKTSAAATSGTSASMTAVPHDSNFAGASSAPLYYTVAPTAGTPVGTIRGMQMFDESAALPGSNTWLWTFGERPAACPVLRGTAQTLEVNLSGVTATQTVTISWEWVEDNS
jgi:hypothetical protein